MSANEPLGRAASILDARHEATPTARERATDLARTSSTWLDRHLALLTTGALLLAFAARMVYVVAQPAVDPSFAVPMLDGEYYLAWARSLLDGTSFVTGAYYLAPLYPWTLAGLIAITGDRVALVYLLQHAGMVAAIGLLAAAAQRKSGSGAALGCVLLASAYHPLAFFASTPLGEWLGLLALAGALAVLTLERPYSATLAGALAGLACLARPNFLLVVALWVGLELIRRRARRGLGLGIAAAVVIAPVTLHNWVASNHLVPISANAGTTLYHGNAPGAYGIGMASVGVSGQIATQAAESTREASRRSGEVLDVVEADRWWGRQALQARAADPLGSVWLIGRRALLTFSNAELSLDYAPAIDDNPWRRLAPIPFAALAALAAAGLALRGWRGSGGAHLWLAVVACAATPILFYVSSRYRLPMAFLLAWPAGAGAAALLGERSTRIRLRGVALALAVGLASWFVPAKDVQAVTAAGALANRAHAWKAANDLDRAQRDLERAVSIDEDSSQAWFGLGVLAERRGRIEEAIAAYERAVAGEPGRAVPAACNWARLEILAGRIARGRDLARRALAADPYHAPCWAQLVTAAYLEGGLEAGRLTVGEARSFGIEVPEDLVAMLESMAAQRESTPSGQSENVE